MTIPYRHPPTMMDEAAMTRILHAIAGTVALLTIALFWMATVVSELSGSTALVVAVKTAIPWGLLVLVPALAAAGGTGFKRAAGRRSPLIQAKMRRMPIVAANGLLILVPSAFYLAFKANAGAFDAAFYAVQALELVAGAVNLMLLGRNMRDGLRMVGRFRARPIT
jgi:hypothetical protein